MARSGEVLTNPRTGERARILTSTAESNGAVLRAELTLPPGGPWSVAHRHRRSEERFRVLAGALAVRLDGEVRLLRAGDVLRVPPGVAHDVRNAGEGDVRVEVELLDPGRFELLLETHWGLARDGHVDGRGTPSALQLAVLARAYADDVDLGCRRSRVRGLRHRVLAPVGRFVGLRPAYARYSLSVAD